MNDDPTGGVIFAAIIRCREAYLKSVPPGIWVEKLQPVQSMANLTVHYPLT